jgi:hypothetical protein
LLTRIAPGVKRVAMLFNPTRHRETVHIPAFIRGSGDKAKACGIVTGIARDVGTHVLDQVRTTEQLYSIRTFLVKS